MKAKYLLAISCLMLTYTLYPRQRGAKGLTAVSQEMQQVKLKAFGILNAKCNFCHKEDNPSKVFTTENMNGYASHIYRQVFVWRRMPKNKAASLSVEEQETLKHWLKDNNVAVKE